MKPACRPPWVAECACHANPCDHLNNPNVYVYWNLRRLFTAVVNVIHKESHFTTHVYLTAYRVMHYGAVLSRPALNVPVYAAITKQCSGCIIQTATCLLITEKHIFTESLFSAAGDGRTAAKTKPKYIHLFHTCSGEAGHTYIHTPTQHACHTWTRTHTHTRMHKHSPLPTRAKSSLKIK